MLNTLGGVTMATKKITTPILENPLSKTKVKRINVHKFEILAKKVKGYLEEEEKKLQEEENGYNQKFRLSFSH